MGVEIALIIAITAGVMSLISGGVSIGSFFHFKKKFSSVTKDTTNIDIVNEMTERDVEHGHERIKRQEIHIEDIDFATVNEEFGFTRTGLPNKTAETLASGAAGALRSIAPASHEIELLALPSVSDSEDEPVIIHKKKHHQREQVAIEIESEDESLDLHRGSGAEEEHVSRHKHHHKKPVKKETFVRHEDSSEDELEVSDSGDEGSKSKHHHKKKHATKKLNEPSATHNDSDEGDSALTIAKLLAPVMDEVGDVLNLPMVANLGLPGIDELVGAEVLGEISGSES